MTVLNTSTSTTVAFDINSLIPPPNSKWGAIGISTCTHNAVLIPMIRRVMPSLIASQIVGVQPMTGPSNSIFGFNRPKHKITKKFVWLPEICEINGRLLWFTYAWQIENLRDKSLGIRWHSPQGHTLWLLRDSK